MPPRRSSRTRASVEPQPPPLPPSKRKRTSPDENEDPVELRSSKPPSKSGKNVAPNRRTAARQSLEDVRESEAEYDEEDSPPAVKKSRPSMGSENDEEEEGELEETKKPSRVRRAPSRKASATTSKRGRKVTVKEEEEEAKAIVEVKSDTEDENPPVKGRRPVTKIPDSSEDEFEDTKPVRKTRGGTVARGAAPKATRGRASAVPKPSGRRGKQASVPPEEPEAAPVETPAQQQDDGSESDALSYFEADAAPKPPATPASKKVPTHSPVPEAEDEEEHSLLDPQTLRTPSRLQPQARVAPAEEPQGPSSRLVIHKMALVNFKSYAGRQEIGPFHKSFSAIVGPNGSGKSNTIDALLFVFGYRASKMRQGKLSELIHNSARHPDLDECSVEVHFRDIVDLPGPDAFDVVPDSTLVVARTAFKNNSSKYTINGRNSNYKEVQALLKGRGIDLDHNRFLILQGEVESIAQMKPKAPSEHEDGLLEYLEDIIGTSRFKEPIEDALQEMDKYSEERIEKLNRLKIVERERNALEQEKKEAEDYLRMQNDHVRALSRLWQWYLWNCLRNDDMIQQRIKTAEADLEKETVANSDDIEHLKQLEEHVAEQLEAYEDVQRGLAEAEKDLAALEKEQVGLVERGKHAKTKFKKLKKSIADDEKARAEAERAVVSNEDKMMKERKNLEEHEESLSREEKVLEEIRDSLKDKTQVYHSQIEVKQKELEPWELQINNKKAEVDIATSERDMLAKKADEAKQACQDAQTILDQLRQDQSAKSNELNELKRERTAKHQEFTDSKKRHQDIQGRVQQLRSKASSSRQKADEAKASQAASTTQNKVLDTLTRLQQTGRITGFHGRLGSLGTIPDKYDVAITTACGALNNMVVDRVEDAQACIEYLRKQNVGRASFMVLEKLSSQGMDKIQTPENVPRLFDLIKPKEDKFAPAFYKAIYNTLVTNDLDHANRIAFGGSRRWRVVTLDGKLIDASGTMSGGGNQVSRGGMSSKLAADTVSPEILRRYEHDSEEAHQELERALAEQREVESELETLNMAGPQIDMAIEKMGLDLQTLARRITDAQKRVRELSGNAKPDSRDLARIATLESQIAASTEELEELEERKTIIDAEIKVLEDKILKIGGSRLLTQKSTVDGILLRLQLATDEITRAEVAKTKAEKDLTKLEKSLRSNNESLVILGNDIEKLDKQLGSCQECMEDISTKVEQARIAEESQKEDMDRKQSELDKQIEAVQAFRQREMELKQIITDAKKEAAENDKFLRHWQSEHDKLQLVDIDEDDEDDEEGNEGQEQPGEPSEGTVEGVKAEGSEPNLKKTRSKPDSLELHTYTDDELSGYRRRELMADAELLDEKLKNAKPNLNVLKDYRKREEEFLRRAQDLEEVTNLRDQQKQKYDDLRKQRLDEFMTGFNLVSLKLKEMYQMITLGGNAELELVDSMDPFSEGIIFSVMPPKKSWKNISNLSGGEKTLSSLALVFALHVYKPTPLYFMDEIDAALDFRNVSIVANYIKDRTKNAQFIIISLRNDMFELSHRLIGIYKTSNVTKSISIDNHDLRAAPVSAVH
ncbi:hypothetical protein PHLGIDRAFT_31603 [Phlebiopsis gigantea 11061_1 CR5-6]|uniref:Structural maintenance of chromosomes protein 4 n=1 Tax=Phlebiopsis gigantea (strain 11061_1 CR5-6) TaxID=745531 RepID=A0A0C3S2N2_PHLG1|nr:hypothetical protein PHLGIDRAFT_31603 [Phlebiopsis gigantea 11061_1 CR5-6]